MKRKFKTLIVLAVLAAGMLVVQNSCKIPAEVSERTGAQLWGENCTRCHNAPPPGEYGDNQWDVVILHMKMKAGLTDAEAQKIVEFLKSGN